MCMNKTVVLIPQRDIKARFHSLSLSHTHTCNSMSIGAGITFDHLHITLNMLSLAAVL